MCFKSGYVYIENMKLLCQFSVFFNSLFNDNVHINISAGKPFVIYIVNVLVDNLGVPLSSYNVQDGFEIHTYEVSGTPFNINSFGEWRFTRRSKSYHSQPNAAYVTHNNSGRPRSARNEENIEQVKTAKSETLQRPVRRIFEDISNSTSATSVFRMLKYGLKLVPYKISIMQHLKPTDIASRLSFAKWMNSRCVIVD